MIKLKLYKPTGLKADSSRAESIRGSWQREVVLVALASLLLVLALLAAIGTRPFNSDDTAQQNAVAQLSLRSHSIIELPQNNYVVKLPLYAVLNWVPLSSESRLIVTVLICNLAGFLIFYWAARALAKTFKYLWVTAVVPFIWLSLPGSQFADILANPNSRNLEIGLAFAALALMAAWYGAEHRTRWSRNWVAIGFAIALGLLFYSDPYFGYFFGLPVLSFFGLKWLLFGKDRKALYLALLVFAALLLEQVWHTLFFLVGIHAGQPSSSFAALPDVLRNLGLLVIGLLDIFQANIFGQTVVSFHSLPTELNFVLLLLALFLPIPLLRSNKVQTVPWKAFLLLLPAFTILGFVASSMVFNVGADHYLVVLPFEAALVYMIALAEAPTFRLRNSLLGLIILATALNLVTTAQTYAERSSDLNSDNQATARIVEANHLTKGFASYWNAGVNQYFANNKVVFIQTGCSPSLGVDVDKLLLNEQELELQSRTSFYLFDPSASRCTESDIAHFFGKPEKILGLSHNRRLLIYDYDITSKVSTR